MKDPSSVHTNSDLFLRKQGKDQRDSQATQRSGDQSKSGTDLAIFIHHFGIYHSVKPQRQGVKKHGSANHRRTTKQA